MTTTASPSGSVSSDPASATSELSQWLYLHTALGKGYIAPLPYAPAWVITAGIPADLVNRMRAAENDFHHEHERSLAESRKKLASLEAEVAMLKRAGGVTPAKNEELKELRERLAAPVFVNYRDWNADRSTLIELLSKSKFRAMSFTDEMGARAHDYTVNKFLAAKHISSDLKLLSLSGDQSSDSVLIRSSATGGANMLSVRGSDTPRFNFMTMTSPAAVAKIAGRLKEAAPCHGITLVLPSPAAHCLSVPFSQIARVIDKVYATASPDNRVTVSLSEAWAGFIGMQPSDVTQSEAGLAAIANSLCNVQTLVRAVTRAAITRKFFLETDNLGSSDEPERSLHLDDGDLLWAKGLFDAVKSQVLGLKHLETRAANLRIANESRLGGPSVEQLIGAKAALIDMIKSEPEGMVSLREAVRRSPELTERLVDAVIDQNPQTFKLLADVVIPGSRRASKKVVVLADGWDKHAMPVGGDDTFTPGSELDDELVDKLYGEWQEAAWDSIKKGGRPAIPIRDLPDVLKPALLAVQKRHWQATTLVPTGEPHEPGGPRTMELWFRYKPNRKPMCNWDESFIGCGLAEKWKAKDDEAQERRIKLGISSGEVES